jgi:hypothetical protein
MSTVQDLMGLGMPGALANRLGNSVNDPLVAAGTSSTTATTIQNHVTNVTAASSQTGVIIPASASIGSVWFISCDHATTATAVVYPPSGATITNASSVNLAQDKDMIVWRISSTKFAHVILA